MRRIAIIGAGAFGTALAMTLAKGGSKDVTLWGRDAGHISEMEERRENTRRLAGHALPAELSLTSRLSDLQQAEAVLLALPAQQTAAFLETNAKALPDAPLILCAKGISTETHRLQSQIAAPFGKTLALTGPGFAADIAAGKPTAMLLAGEDDLTAEWQAALSNATMRLYRSDDLIGAQLGGALKNVVAIAAGITLGAGLGESARAAVITRGFAEMTRLTLAMGGRDETLRGLSGFGDLVLTASSEKSRNYAHGLAVGAGKPLAHNTIEGIATAEATCRLAQQYGIDMPLAQAVHAILSGKSSIEDTIAALLRRPLGRE